jgi:very-short-patch-repair endonuclease
MKQYFSNKNRLKDFRKELRKNSTSAEATLWELLKDKKLDNRKFRRQHSLGRYIVDFYCSTEKLIIELDGNLHGVYFKIEEDKERDKYLIELGYNVLRFENRLVFQDPEYVLEEIRKQFRDKPPPP